MNILVITDLYPVNEDEKYTPKTIYDFVQTWKSLGHKVKIIKPNFILNSFLRKKPFYKSGIYGDVENINYWLPFIGNIKNKIRTDIIADIVIAHMPSGLIFAQKLGLNYTAAVHYSDIEVLTNSLYGIYFKPELEKAYNMAKKIACRSFVLKNKFLEIYPEYEGKTFVAPSGIKKNIIIKRCWENRNKTKVLTCGQFIQRKNIDKVIKACDEFSNIELTVIGSGEKEEELKSLSSKPIFTGQLSHDEVLQKMRDSDIFILPSIKETFGMVYLEAMASGCITICTKGDGVDGIITDGENGFLTEPGEVKETLDRVINIPDKQRILDNTYNTILQYTLEKTAKDYLKNINN